jgi:hypothetical protein
MLTCKTLNCNLELSERAGAKSKRKGETLLICPAGHKWQGRYDGATCRIYKTNSWKNRISEDKKQVAVSASASDRALMKQKGVMPQAVWNLGIDILRDM